MSKYEQLWKHIQANGSSTLKLSFEEIKNIVGFEIDHSFLSYKKEAAQFGYRVGKISLKEKYVAFDRIGK
ncbi:MAG: hypothetical protein LBQ18_03765 [Campylobacteraceae bacterium]|jgi:hypothetical protein|nr:hypothetical protein [Campylobacteraceae bacterium]